MKQQLTLLCEIIVCVLAGRYSGGVPGDLILMAAAFLCIAFALGEWPWDRI